MEPASLLILTEFMQFNVFHFVSQGGKVDGFEGFIDDLLQVSIHTFVFIILLQKH